MYIAALGLQKFAKANLDIFHDYQFIQLSRKHKPLRINNDNSKMNKSTAGS